MSDGTRQGYVRKRILKLAGLFISMSSKPPYNKPHISYDAQIDKLIGRGFLIDDRNAALRQLQHISYYRLGLYWDSFEIDDTTHELKSGTHFTDVVALYEFDRELRRLVFHSIEHLEISMRTQWASSLSAAYGSHAYLEPEAHFCSFGPKKRNLWKENITRLLEEFVRSDDPLINEPEKRKNLKKNISKFLKELNNSDVKNQLGKYIDEFPNIWAVSEIMSFGLLSKWYKNLRDNKVRKAVAHIYNVHPEVLESWMQHLTVVRNNCAHHSRLWNRQFNRVKPKHSRGIAKDNFVEGHPLFNTLTIILYLLDIISTNHSWREQFIQLCEAYPSVALCEMGFPGNWRE